MWLLFALYCWLAGCLMFTSMRREAPYVYLPTWLVLFMALATGWLLAPMGALIVIVAGMTAWRAQRRDRRLDTRLAQESSVLAAMRMAARQDAADARERELAALTAALDAAWQQHRQAKEEE